MIELIALYCLYAVTQAVLLTRQMVPGDVTFFWVTFTLAPLFSILLIIELAYKTTTSLLK
jgi:hypothetical protein